jgi:hypothetical protein
MLTYVEKLNPILGDLEVIQIFNLKHHKRHFSIYQDQEYFNQQGY